MYALEYAHPRNMHTTGNVNLLNKFLNKGYK